MNCSTACPTIRSHWRNTCGSRRLQTAQFLRASAFHRLGIAARQMAGQPEKPHRPAGKAKWLVRSRALTTRSSGSWSNTRQEGTWWSGSERPQPKRELAYGRPSSRCAARRAAFAEFRKNLGRLGVSTPKARGLWATRVLRPTPPVPGWESLPEADEIARRIGAHPVSELERNHRRAHNLGSLK